MTRPGLLPLMRRWWWLLAASTVAAAVVAWPLASGLPRTYAADAKLLVGPVNADYPTLEAAGALSRTYGELAQSRRLVEAAARSARVKLTRRQVETAITATSNDVTRVLDVSARYSDPDGAARLAGAIAAQLMQVQRQAPTMEVDPVTAIMNDLRGVALSRGERRAVHNAAVAVVGESHAGDLRLVDAPVRPQRPTGPPVGLLIVAAGLAAGLAAAAFVLVRDALSAPSPAPEEFDVETFFPSANGDEDQAPRAAVERWLDETRSRERS